MSEPVSLIQDQSQPDLLPTVGDSFFSQMDSKGEFTGDRLFQKRPDAYRAVVVLLGQKMGVIRIGKLLGLSPNTVMAVRDREQPSIDIVKEHLARTSHAGAALASEVMLGNLNRIAELDVPLAIKDLKDLAVCYGILVQNAQLLAGQPTARVEVHELQRPGHDDFNRYISGLPEAKITHLEGEKVAQKEGRVDSFKGDPAAVTTLACAQAEPATAGSAARVLVEEPTSQAPAIEAREAQPAPGTDERSEGEPTKA